MKVSSEQARYYGLCLLEDVGFRDPPSIRRLGSEITAPFDLLQQYLSNSRFECNKGFQFPIAMLRFNRLHVRRFQKGSELQYSNRKTKVKQRIIRLSKL